MRAILGLVLLVAASSAADSQTVERIEIVEHGIYSSKIGAATSEPGAVNAHRLEVSNLKLMETTTKIPAQVGVEFGFRYRVIGAPNGAAIQLRKVTIVPEPGIRNPKTGNTMIRGEIAYQEKIGETTYKGYHFEDPWELVPGTWTFELWQGDRKLGSQSFEVAKP